MGLFGIKIVVYFNVTSCSLVDDNQKHKCFCCAYLLSWGWKQPVSLRIRNITVHRTATKH